MLAVKANQPTLRAESEDLFEATPADELESFSDDVMDLSLCGVAFLWESSPASKPQ